MPNQAPIPERLCALKVAALILVLLAVGGCTRIPAGRSAVNSVEIRGVHGVGAGKVRERIATSSSPKFLYLFRGIIYEYELYDPSVLQRDLARIQRYCRSRGFLEANVRAARVRQRDENHVDIEIIVDEGTPTLNRDIHIDGIDELPEPAAHAARDAARSALREGHRFGEDEYKAAQVQVQRALTDLGYAYAKVTARADLDVGTHHADYFLEVRPGPVAKFGPIAFTGLDPDGDGPAKAEIHEAPLRRALKLQEGKRYSTAILDSDTRTLLDLGVLSSVQITPTLSDSSPPPEVVPLTIDVAQTNLRQIRLGGGAEFDELKTALHLLTGWEDHNFLGGLRDFRVDFLPGAVFYPTRLGNLVVPDQVLLEERLRALLRQPQFFDAHTTAFLRPEFNVFPLLVESDPKVDDSVVGYKEVKGAIGIDRHLWKFYASLGYDLQVEAPFAYRGPLDPALETLVVAYPELITTLDLRDNELQPHEGIYLSNRLQIAGGIFGGDVRDIRIEPEIRGYVPIGHKTTFATRALIGLLFPRNYGLVVEDRLDDPVTAANRAIRVRDIQTVLFRGFYSGGPNSNRGFPIRGLAPYGFVPFLDPATASQQIANQCDPTKNLTCSTPIAGFTLWEFSNEVRTRLAGPLTGALFCDMSDVSQHQTNLRFDHPHLSCGLGARYDTPVGPIRLDVGYRIPPLQVLGYPNETAAWLADPTNGQPQRLFGQPIAVALAIGEAF